MLLQIWICRVTQELQSSALETACQLEGSTSFWKPVVEPVRSLKSLLHRSSPGRRYTGSRGTCGLDSIQPIRKASDFRSRLQGLHSWAASATRMCLILARAGLALSAGTSAWSSNLQISGHGEVIVVTTIQFCKRTWQHIWTTCSMFTSVPACLDIVTRRKCNVASQTQCNVIVRSIVTCAEAVPCLDLSCQDRSIGKISIAMTAAMAATGQALSFGGQGQLISFESWTHCSMLEACFFGAD